MNLKVTRRTGKFLLAAGVVCLTALITAFHLLSEGDAAQTAEVLLSLIFFF